MKRQRIAEEWNSYAVNVLPKNAPTVQRRECRMAFYGGVAAMIGILFNIADSADEEAMMRELCEELSNAPIGVPRV